MASPAVQLGHKPSVQIGTPFLHRPLAKSPVVGLRCALAPNLQRSWVFLLSGDQPLVSAVLLDGAEYRVVSGAHASHGRLVGYAGSRGPCRPSIALILMGD